VPEAVRERLRRAGEHGLTAGLEITYELIDAVLPAVRGAYIMPLDRYDLAGQVLQYIRGKLPAETTGAEGIVASHAPLAAAP